MYVEFVLSKCIVEYICRKHIVEILSRNIFDVEIDSRNDSLKSVELAYTHVLLSVEMLCRKQLTTDYVLGKHSRQ